MTHHLYDPFIMTHHAGDSWNIWFNSSGCIMALDVVDGGAVDLCGGIGALLTNFVGVLIGDAFILLAPRVVEWWLIIDDVIGWEWWLIGWLWANVATGGGICWLGVLSDDNLFN